NNIWLARRCPAFATNRLCQCREPLVGTCDRARKRNGHALHTGCLPRSPYPTIVYRELCACCRCLNRWLCIGVFCFENCRGAHPCWNTPRRNPNSHECASSFVSTGHNASDDDPVRSCPGSPHYARQLAAAPRGQRKVVPTPLPLPVSRGCKLPPIVCGGGAWPHSIGVRSVVLGANTRLGTRH